MSAGHWRGIDAQRLSAGDATLVVLPSRGGKIASLEHAGFEWLLQPPDAVPPPPAPGEDFVPAGLWGWDEMLPTIDACELTVAGSVVQLPDHGEVWRVPWEGTETLSCTGRALPYLIERTIEPTGPRSFAFTYRLSTMSSTPVPVLWAAHPQLRAGADCIIALPGEVTEVLDVVAPGGPVRRPWPVGAGPSAGSVSGSPGGTVPRSSAGAGASPGSVPPSSPSGAGASSGSVPRAGPIPQSSAGAGLQWLPEGGSAKLYVPPDVPVSWAGLVRADGRWLVMRWQAGAAPYLGVWLDRSALAPEPVVALEPASGFYDDLNRAVHAGAVSFVRADAPLRWRLEVEVGRGAPPPWH